MTPQAAESLLKLFGAVRIDKSTMPWLTGNCPLARWRHQKGTDTEPSFGVWTGHGRMRVHCLSCNFSGSGDDLIGEIMIQAKLGGEPHGFDLKAAADIIEQDLGQLDLSILTEEQRAAGPTVEFPEKFWDSFVPVANVPEAWTYLANRGLSIPEIVGYDFRWDGIQRRVCVPVRGADGKLYGIRGRQIDGHKSSPRYHSYPCSKITNPQVWLGENMMDLDLPVIVVESVFQRIAVRRVYKNTIAPLSASIYRPQCDRIADAYCIVHLLDNDKAGHHGSVRLRDHMRKADHVALIGYLPEGKGPDDISLSALRDVISRAIPL